MRRFYKWTVDIEVEETWVEDGFDLTDERAHAMVCSDLRYAFGREIRCKVTARPPDDAVASAQGYSSVEEYRRARKERS